MLGVEAPQGIERTVKTSHEKQPSLYLSIVLLIARGGEEHAGADEGDCNLVRGC